MPGSRSILSAAGVFFCLALRVLSAQVQNGPVHVHVVAFKPRLSPSQELANQEVPVVEKLNLARRANTEPPYPEARVAIDDSIRSFNRWLTVDIPPPESIATLTFHGQDIAIAHGQYSETSEGSIQYLLWNEPHRSSLLLAVPRTTLESPALIEGLLKQIISWTPRSGLKEIAAYWFRDPRDGSIALVGSGADRLPRQFDMGPEYLISGISNGTPGWISLTSRANSRPELSVAERFPPVRARIATWTKAELMRATVHKPRGDTLGKGFATDEVLREGIILNELIGRDDLTPTDFQDLIQRRVGDPSMHQTPATMRAAVRTGKGARFIPVMLDYFAKMKLRNPALAQRDATPLMYQAAQDERPEFCDLALGFLKDDLAVKQSALYTGRFCRHAPDQIDNQPATK